MEDGENNSRQSNHENNESKFFYISDAMEKIKMIRDFVEPFMKSESLDVKTNRLKRKLDLLKGKEEDVNVELNYAESLSLKRRKKEVETWLKHVEHVKVEVHRTEQDVRESGGAWLPKLKLPEKVDRLTLEVEELYRRGEFSGGLTLDAQESRGITFPTTELVGQRFLENKKLILDSLKDDNVLRIGIYGMGGVGKTTLLTHVNNELLQNCQDTSVFWVTVSQKFTIHKLQDDIAAALQFSFSRAEDERKRAAELWNFLGRRNLKWVLILDDVWEDIPLDDVGVPVSANGCKPILTTRSLEVCRRMDCQKKIRVMPLCEEESWDLFRNKLGDDVELSPQIEGVAKTLVRECAGLPLGIITMARSMRGVDDLFEWKNALENMKESKSEHDDMGTRVFQVLKYSYDMLKDPAVQQCFLNCSLYPEDFEIERDVLIEQLIDEGLIDRIKSRQAKFYRGHTMLNKLVNACLLEDVETRGRWCVKMHDLVRDMALQITSESPRFLVEAGKGLTYFPDEELWKDDLEKVSLMGNHISEIPSNFKPPNCPKLSTFMLNSNIHLSSISEDFFLHMKGLSLLDLSHTYIQSLPVSIFELASLSALLLKECRRLNFVPSLAKLTALKKLDLFKSAVSEVPDGIENLLELRYLDLQPNSRWSDKEGKMMISGTQLVPLRKLENLYCMFRNVDSFSEYARSLRDRGPASYKLHLGMFDQEMTSISQPYNKTIICSCFYFDGYNYELCTTQESRPIPKSNVMFLPKCVESLVIEYCNTRGGALCDFMSFEKAANLISCCVTHSTGFEHLFSYSPSTSPSPFRTIEKLRLESVDSLRGLIYWGQQQLSMLPSSQVTYSSLKELTLYCCPRMKRLFANASLPNLETITIFDCASLVNVTSSTISTDRGVVDIPVTVALPKLAKLDLNFLRSLETVEVISDSVQVVKIVGCPKLKRIPLLDRQRCPPSLQEVCIDEDLMESLKWDHHEAKAFVRSLNEPTESDHRELENLWNNREAWR